VASHDLPGEEEAQIRRGVDQPQAPLFRYVSLEQRVPPEHPLRTLRQRVDTALVGVWERFAALSAQTGRPAIAPERLLRALLLQSL
jgi:transposase